MDATEDIISYVDSLISTTNLAIAVMLRVLPSLSPIPTYAIAICWGRGLQHGLGWPDSHLSETHTVLSSILPQYYLDHYKRWWTEGADSTEWQLTQQLQPRAAVCMESQSGHAIYGVLKASNPEYATKSETRSKEWKLCMATSWKVSMMMAPPCK